VKALTVISQAARDDRYLSTSWLRNVALYSAVSDAADRSPLRRRAGRLRNVIIGRRISKSAADAVSIAKAYIDARILIAAGLAMTGMALHLMTGFTPDVSQSTLIRTGLPLSRGAFGTLVPALRTQATGLYNLEPVFS
jgi:hypothetical protein